jgi:uncharacterized protein
MQKSNQDELKTILFSGLSGESIQILTEKVHLLPEIPEKYPNSNLAKHLIEGFFVVETNTNETIELGSGLDRLSNQQWASYSIIPTYICNHRCEYCYQSHQAVIMKQDICDKVLQWILNHSVDKETLDLHLFGGEPLLQPDILSWFIKNLEDYKKMLKITLISSLTPMTQDVVDMFSTGQLQNVLTTLDGLKSTHDKRRPLINAKLSSYESTLDGLRKIVDLTDRITIRVNLDRSNVEDVPTLLDNLKSAFKNNKVCLEPAPVVNVGNLQPSNKLYNQREWAKIIHNLAKIIQDKGFTIHPLYAGYPCTRLEGCNAYSLKRPIISPTGHFYFCDYLTTSPKHSLGDVYNGLDTSRTKSQIIDNYELKGCSNCRTVAFCGGPCIPLEENDDGCRFIHYLSTSPN